MSVEGAPAHASVVPLWVKQTETESLLVAPLPPSVSVRQEQQRMLTMGW